MNTTTTTFLKCIIRGLYRKLFISRSQAPDAREIDTRDEKLIGVLHPKKLRGDENAL